jgi:hypothetical protein
VAVILAMRRSTISKFPKWGYRSKIPNRLPPLPSFLRVSKVFFL